MVRYFREQLQLRIVGKQTTTTTTTTRSSSKILVTGNATEEKGKRWSGEEGEGGGEGRGEEKVRDSTVGAKQHLIWERAAAEVRQQLGQYFIAPRQLDNFAVRQKYDCSAVWKRGLTLGSG